MKILGIDFGTKRIGLAVSDPLGMIAIGRDTLIRTSLNKDLAHIENIVSQESIELIVLGFPLNMDGSKSVIGVKVQEFANRLEEFLQIKVKLWDERLSSVQAERALIKGNVRRKARKEKRDQLAAVLILQNYLDSPHKT